MISRRSSGSRRDASAGEPTKSQNSTAGCRRSTDDIGGAGRGIAASAGHSMPRVMEHPQMVTWSKDELRRIGEADDLHFSSAFPAVQDSLYCGRCPSMRVSSSSSSQARCCLSSLICASKPSSISTTFWYSVHSASNLASLATNSRTASSSSEYRANNDRTRSTIPSVPILNDPLFAPPVAYDAHLGRQIRALSVGSHPRFQDWPASICRRRLRCSRLRPGRDA